MTLLYNLVSRKIFIELCGMPTAKILSVEDEDILRQGLEILLTGEGFEVLTAIHGQDALKKLERGFAADILLVDNNMPVMGGIEFIQRIKHMPEYANIPVVFLSAQTNTEDIMTALRSGAIDYITKPYDPADLFQRLDRATQIGLQLQLATTLQEQYEALQRQCQSVAQLAYVEMHLASMPEAEAIARFIASDFHNDLRPQITVGVLEALSNAVIHGNCEISSEIREQKNGYMLLQKELDRRMQLAPYKDRKVVIRRTTDASSITFEIIDEGPGFDVANIPDPRNPENVVKKSGRGILLMQLYFESVEFNAKGNAVILKKML